MIPSSVNPEEYIVDEAGRFPYDIDHINTSQEDLLRRIGTGVLQSSYLSIDRVLKRSNVVDVSGKSINVSDILTDALNPDETQLNDGYKWSKV